MKLSKKKWCCNVNKHGGLVPWSWVATVNKLCTVQLPLSGPSLKMIKFCTKDIDFSHKLAPAQAFLSLVGAFYACHGICQIIMRCVCAAALEGQFCHRNGTLVSWCSGAFLLYERTITVFYSRVAKQCLIFKYIFEKL
jgi:hypothetical protein